MTANSASQPRAYVTPRALLTGAGAAEAVAAGWAWPLLGGRLAFGAMDVSMRKDGAVVRLGAIVRADYEKDASAIAPALRAAIESQVAALAPSRPAFAGFDGEEPVLMGVLNVTPDSFSDGGSHAGPDAALAHAVVLLEAGAAIIDVGGESTRPGATPVAEAEEIKRVMPVIRTLAARRIPFSIDTRHATVMAEALAAGAVVVNDISALAGDSKSLETVARSKASVVLVHMLGEPGTMQRNPVYDWAPGDIFDFLGLRIAACIAAGIPRARIAVDPGLGFGKTDLHNAQIMNHLALYHGLGCRLVLGASRKGFIGRMSRGEAALNRLPGSLAAALHAVGQGAQILRVHDVAETRQALAVAARLAGGQ